MYAALHPGETIQFRFDAPIPQPNMARSFILRSHGRYEKLDGASVAGAPESFSLSQNYPNPFNPQTTVSYQLAAPGRVAVTVYDLLGREVARLADETQEAGYYERSWDAGNSPSGIYYVRMIVSDHYGKELYRDTKKLLLIR